MPPSSSLSSGADENRLIDGEFSTKRRHHRDWLRRLIVEHAHNHPNMPHGLKEKALVLAPMVDASDLPFRLLARRYNASLCFTPMIHARMFIEKPGYRRKFWKVNEGMPFQDRPLIAQFCGSDKDVLLKAMKVVESHVDGVDINCGCPQFIAKKGRYGAFLLEEENGDRIVEIVRYLSENLNVPVCVKVRILPSGLEDSLILYKRLVDAGASMLTIHGRTRLQNKGLTGEANWSFVREVVKQLGFLVPVLSNGSICNLDDVRKCLKETCADGVMSSEAILEYPAVFTETNVFSTDYKRTGPGRLRMAEDYLELCKTFPPDKGGQGSGLKCIRAHLHRFLHADLQVHTSARDALIEASTMEAAYNVVRMIKQTQEQEEHDMSTEQLSWYFRHRTGMKNEDDHFDQDHTCSKDKTSMIPEDEQCCQMRDIFEDSCSVDDDY